MSPSPISEQLFKNLSEIKHLRVDISGLCCVDVAQISSTPTAFETSRMLEDAISNDKTNDPVKTLETKFGISNVRANNLLQHFTSVTANFLANVELRNKKKNPIRYYNENSHGRLCSSLCGVLSCIVF